MTEPYYADESVRLFAGDCLDVLRELPDASIDAVVTDPPYGLAFMGKAWDDHVDGARFGAWCLEWSIECLRVLKPGGHMLAFGGSRTWHRLACAVEDAGFELRDSIAWLYASGFPKSLDVSKAIDKAAGAGREVVGRTRTPFKVDAAAGRGTSLQGSVNGDFSRQVDNNGYRYTEHTAPATDAARQWQGWGTALKPAFEPIVVARKPLASPDVNVQATIESGLRERGIEGPIAWVRESVATAAKRSRAKTSREPMQTPVAHAAESEMPSSESASARDSARTMPPGEQPTESMSASTLAGKPRNSEPRSSQPTDPPATAAERIETPSSPSTTSKAEGVSTARRSTARSSTNSDAKDSRPDTESFAGIATGLIDSRTHVHINRNPDGSFVWPDGLPTFVRGASLTVAANVQQHGTGALNIDATRVQSGERPKMVRTSNLTAASSMSGESTGSTTSGELTTQGRWPSNLVLTHAPDCTPNGAPDGGLWACADGCPVRELDRQSGQSASPGTYARSTVVENHVYGASNDRPIQRGHGDSGGASRFFPTFRYEPKAPTSERPRVKAEDPGAALLDQKNVRECNACGSRAKPSGPLNGRAWPACGHDDWSWVKEHRATGAEYTAHPTVKPLDLMRWAVRLVTPPGGTVLDLFAGSGTTGEACVLEGFDCILIERERTYLPLIVQRLTKPLQPDLFGGAA